MFAMKRVIISAAFILALSGLAAAQSTSSKHAPKKETKGQVARHPVVKENTRNMLPRQEASPYSKSDTSARLILPKPTFVSDTTAMPVVKNDQGY